MSVVPLGPRPGGPTAQSPPRVPAKGRVGHFRAPREDGAQRLTCVQNPQPSSAAPKGRPSLPGVAEGPRGAGGGSIGNPPPHVSLPRLGWEERKIFPGKESILMIFIIKANLNQWRGSRCLINLSEDLNINDQN